MPTLPRLLATALSGAATDGAELALLHSSPMAIGFYDRCGFSELETGRAAAARSGRPLLSIVPTTMWGESEAS